MSARVPFVPTQVPGSDNFSLSAPTLAQVNASTNSIGFKNAVNAANLCGSGEWRLPTKAELLGLVKTTAPAPKIDATWFPNTSADSFYWTSSPDPVNSFEAANVEKKHLGLIAEDMNQLVPEVVAVEDGKCLGMDYSSLVPVLIKAMQEQQAMIAAQNAKIAAMEAELAKVVGK